MSNSVSIVILFTFLSTSVFAIESSKNNFSVQVQILKPSSPVKSSKLVFKNNICSGFNGDLKIEHLPKVCTDFYSLYSKELNKNHKSNIRLSNHIVRFKISSQLESLKWDTTIEAYESGVCDIEDENKCRYEEPLPLRSMALYVLETNLKKK